MAGVSNWTADIPGLAVTAEILSRFARADRALRMIQAQNAPIASYFEQATLTDAAVVRIAPALSGAEQFSSLVVMFDQASGRGRYLMTGQMPTAAGVGLPIASGGAIVTLAGAQNVANFAMIAEAGQTLNFALVVFK